MRQIFSAHLIALMIQISILGEATGASIDDQCKHIDNDNLAIACLERAKEIRKSNKITDINDNVASYYYKEKKYDLEIDALNQKLQYTKDVPTMTMKAYAQLFKYLTDRNSNSGIISLDESIITLREAIMESDEQIKEFQIKNKSTITAFNLRLRITLIDFNKYKCDKNAFRATLNDINTYITNYGPNSIIESHYKDLINTITAFENRCQ